MGHGAAACRPDDGDAETEGPGGDAERPDQAHAGTNSTVQELPLHVDILRPPPESEVFVPLRAAADRLDACGSGPAQPAPVRVVEGAGAQSRRHALAGDLHHDRAFGDDGLHLVGLAGDGRESHGRTEGVPVRA